MGTITLIISSTWTFIKWCLVFLRGKDAQNLFKIGLILAKKGKNEYFDDVLKTALPLLAHIDSAYKVLGSEQFDEVAKELSANNTLFKKYQVKYNVDSKDFQIGNGLVKFNYNPKTGKVSYDLNIESK